MYKLLHIPSSQYVYFVATTFNATYFIESALLFNMKASLLTFGSEKEWISFDKVRLIMDIEDDILDAYDTNKITETEFALIEMER